MNERPVAVLPTLPGTWIWPDGLANTSPLTVEALALQVARLQQAGDGLPWMGRPAAWAAFVQQRRPDLPIPLALVDFEYALGDGMPRHAFAAAPLMHAPFGNGPATLRSRVVQWWLDPRFFAGPGAFPKDLHLDAGDGLGPRAPGPDGLVTAAYGQAVDQVRLTLSSGGRRAEACIAVGPPAAPCPDQTLALPGATAWVFRAPRPGSQRHTLLVCEGFPGGYACDYLHDMLAQAGLMAALHARGFDVALLGLHDGLGPIDASAAAMQGAIRALDPVVAGGVSMGGLVARQALATMDHRGQPHRVALFFTLDTPHQGAYTPMSVQWFVHAYGQRLPGAAEAAALIDSVANQQFVCNWLRAGSDGSGWHTGPSAQREAWLARLAAVGDYPTRPRKLALSCGRGDGRRTAPPGVEQMRWDDGTAFRGSLRALGGTAPVGDGTGTLWPALPAQMEEPAWDGLPGGTNPYVAIAAALLAAEGLQPQLSQPLNLSIPTVSALDIDAPPDQPIPPDARTPFDAWHCADDNLPHLTITPALRDALLAELPALPPDDEGPR